MQHCAQLTQLRNTLRTAGDELTREYERLREEGETDRTRVDALKAVYHESQARALTP